MKDRKTRVSSARPFTSWMGDFCDKKGSLHESEIWDSKIFQSCSVRFDKVIIPSVSAYFQLTTYVTIQFGPSSDHPTSRSRNTKSDNVFIGLWFHFSWWGTHFLKRRVTHLKAPSQYNNLRKIVEIKRTKGSFTISHEKILESAFNKLGRKKSINFKGM